MDIGKRYAIVIGVADYDDEQIGSLQHTKNDATRVADLLVRHGGVDRSRVYLLVNGIPEEEQCVVDPRSPTRGELLQKVQYVVDAAGDQDLILLFFAGHGAEVSKNPYLLTCDTRMDVLQRTAVKVTDLNEMLADAKARCIVRVFDACRSPFAEARGAVGRMTNGLQQAMLKTAKGWASFSSCSGGEVAHESGELGHGIFSYYFCEGLEGKAINEKGEVTFDRLVDYVKTSVGNWSDEQSQRQTPHAQSDLAGMLVLSTVAKPPKVGPADSANPLDVLRLGIDKYLSQTPDDSRNLTFTDEGEWGRVFQLAEGSVRETARDFSHPSLVLSVSEAKPLPQVGGRASNAFGHDVDQKRVRTEYKGPIEAVQLRFSSSEVVLPHTILTLVVARFSYFYWLWYMHECGQEQLRGTFSPQPPFTKGFFTFKPRAALDGRRIDNAIKELLKRVCEDILLWAEQLGKSVDSRIDPLRENGEIVG